MGWGWEFFLSMTRKRGEQAERTSLCARTMSPSHTCKRQCFSSGDDVGGLFYDNTLMPLFLQPPSQTLLCYYVSEWQPLSNPSLGSITCLYSIAHWLGIFSGGEQSSVDVVITKSRSECYLRSGVITASLLFITLPVL